MGYYIETDSRFKKATYLILNHGAQLISGPPTWRDDKAIICVAHNGDFEAAGYCFSPAELEAFSVPGDPRPKDWLLMDKNLAQRLSGYT